MCSGQQRPKVQTPRNHSAEMGREEESELNKQEGKLKYDGCGNGEGVRWMDGDRWKIGKTVKTLVRVLGLYLLPAAHKCGFISLSLAINLGPNGEMCEDELGQHGCREHCTHHLRKDKNIHHLILMENRKDAPQASAAILF